MKRDMIERFAFIETQVWWGDGLTAQALGQAFGIARQNAQQTISAYKRRHPDNLRYDPKRRRQVASDTFQPFYIHKNPERFLDYLRGSHMVALFREEAEAGDMPFEDLDQRIHHYYDAESMRTLLGALRHGEAVRVLYRSRYRREWRQLSPHHLVYADGRYHVRAYCHLLATYGDFVLSRMEMVQEPDPNAWVSDAEDQEWHQRIDVHYRINPDLPEEAKESLRYDYHTDSQDRLTFKGVRKALVKYLDRRFIRVDPYLGMPNWTVESPPSRPRLPSLEG